MNSFTRLKARFTLLCGVLTGAVLLAACFLGYQNAKTQATQAYDELFGTQVAALESQLRRDSAIGELQVYQFEMQNGLALSLIDNGYLIQFNSAFPAQLRRQLLEKAAAHTGYTHPYKEESLRFSLSTTAETSAEILDNEYAARYLCLSSAKGGWLAMLAFKPLASQQADLASARLLYSLIFLGGFVLLLGASMLVAHLAVLPAKRAAQQQAEFVAAAGHELKSPLAVVQSSAEMVLKDTTGQQEYVQNILSETRRLTHLVNDLLLLAGGEAGKLNVRCKTLPTDTLLISVYDRFLPLAKAQGFALALVLPADTLPNIFADEERIVQLLSILLANAFQYSTPGTGVEMLASSGTGTVVFTVADHGPGVPDAQKKKIFARFYRAEESHTSKEHYGLGLAVAQDLAALHGGKLWVHNTPGGGASFSFTIPTGAKRGKV